MRKVLNRIPQRGGGIGVATKRIIVAAMLAVVAGMTAIVLSGTFSHAGTDLSTGLDDANTTITVGQSFTVTNAKYLGHPRIWWGCNDPNYPKPFTCIEHTIKDKPGTFTVTASNLVGFTPRGALNPVPYTQDDVDYMGLAQVWLIQQGIGKANDWWQFADAASCVNNSCQFKEQGGWDHVTTAGGIKTTLAQHFQNATGKDWHEYDTWFKQNRSKYTVQGFMFDTGDLQTMAYFLVKSLGKIQIQKKSDNPNFTKGNTFYNLALAKYGIWSNAQCSGNPITTLTTGNDARTGTAELAPGKYYIKEINAPNGYYISTEIKGVSVEAGKTTTPIVTEKPKKGKITIHKKADSTIQLNGNYSLKGAKFNVKDSAGKVTTVETDAQGNATIENLPFGDVYITEIQAPTNFKLPEGNAATQKLTIKTDIAQTATFVEKPELGNVTLTKTDDKTGTKLAKATFALYKDEACKNIFKDNLTTNDKGIITVDNVPFGDYWFKETKAPAHYDGDLKKTYKVTSSKDGKAKESTVTITNPHAQPTVHTTASGTSGKTIPATNDVKIIDTITYTDLYTGEYTVTGTIHVKETDEQGNAKDAGVLKNKDGKDATTTSTFTTDKENGTWQMTFDVDAEGLGGKELVVFEYVTGGPEKNPQDIKHEDIEDKEQTVNVPLIGTTLTDTITKDHDGIRYEDDTENNEVASDEIQQTETTKNANETMAESDGTSEHSKDASKTDEEKDASKTDDASKSTDDDMADDSASSDAKGRKRQVELADVVTYTGLNTSEQATVTGYLHVIGADGSDMGVLMKDGTIMKEDAEGYDKANAVFGMTQFKPDKPDGSVIVTFKFDATPLEGEKVVAFEYLDIGDVRYAVHTDITDENQIVKYPKIRTMATGTDTKSHTVQPTNDAKVTDTVSYENLDPNKWYEVTGTIHVRNEDGTDAGFLMTDGSIKTQEEIDAMDTDDDDSDTTNTETSDTNETNGDTAGNAETTGKSKVQDTDTSKTDTTETKADKADSIDGTSTEKDDSAGSDDVSNAGDTTSDDTSKPDSNDDIVSAVVPVTSHARFQPTAESGTVEVLFEFDASKLTNRVIVVFEELYKIPTCDTPNTPADNDSSNTDNDGSGDDASKDDETPKDDTADDESTCSNDGNDIKRDEYGRPSDGLEVTWHKDITDDDQSVHFPGVLTDATDTKNGTHQSLAEQETHLTDSVSYTGLVPGTEYTITGYLHARDEKTNEDLGVIMLDGTIGDASLATPETAVTASKTFTPTEANGTETLEFVYDATKLHGAPVVAFETLLQNGVVVAVHADITDENQTVHIPFIGTLAKASDGSKTAKYGEDVVRDTVSYAGLIPGQSYVMTGHMVDKNGKAISDDASVSFTPTESSGEVTVEIPVKTLTLGGQHIVAFEELKDDKGNVIGKHEDLNDENQGIDVEKPSISGTGDDNAWLGTLTQVLGVLAGVIITLAFTRRVKA